MRPLSEDFEERFAELVRYRTVGRRQVADLLGRVEDWTDREDVRHARLGEIDGAFDLYLEMGPTAEPGRTASERGLVLCGHVDVVPADEDGWESDPFALTDRGDRWVARGSADMKGFVALALDRFLARRGADLAAPLGLLLTFDEEVGSLGAQRLTPEDVEGMPRSVLIGEPTELAALSTHKGHLRLRLDFEGKSAHSGYPLRGVNAIEPAAAAVRALGELRRELEAERLPASRHFPETPWAALNIGRIRGGSAVNVVPASCRVELGIRLLPGMDATATTERVRGAVAATLRDAGIGWSLEVDNVSPPLETPPGARLVRELHALLGQGDVRAASYSSDGGTLAGLGLEPVLFGPGSIEVAHRPDEHLPKGQTVEAARHVDRLIDRLCLGDRS